MPDKEHFFTEARRVLKPNGSFVICAWLTSENPRNWEVNHLLEPICREGRLPSMGSESDYCHYFESTGFQVETVLDISHQVKKTWTLSIQGILKHFLKSPQDLRYLSRKFNQNAEFFKTLFRIRLAYETGSMRYCLFKGRALDLSM